jgi:hypothetical protein
MHHLLDCLTRLISPLTAAWDQEFGRPAPRRVVPGVPAEEVGTTRNNSPAELTPMEIAPCPEPPPAPPSDRPPSPPATGGGRASTPGSAAKPAPRRTRKKTPARSPTGTSGGG